MKDNMKSNSLVEAALMSGITFILMMLTTLPIFDLIGAFIIPIPIAILYLRHSKRAAWLSSVVSGILLGLFYSPIAGFQSIIVYGVMGIALGYCIGNKKSPVKTLVYLIGANSIGTLLQLTLGFVVFSKITLHDFLQQIVDTFQETVKLMTDMGLNNASTSQVIDMYKSIDVKTLMMILPAVLIIQTVIAAFFNYQVTKSILKKLGYEMESLPKFSRWYIDCRVGAGLILVTCIATIIKSKGIQYGDTIFVTVYYILMFSFITVGLSLVIYFLKNKLKMGNGSVIILTIFIITSPISVYLFVLGIIDLIVDIRGIDPNSLGTFIRMKLKIN